MASKSASLLTKTQRRRLRNEFEELDEGAKRRDQQLIRERVRSGLFDFELLADYPDDQFELAFEDVSDEALRAALVDTYLTADRIRDLHRFDRDQLLTEVRARAEDISEEATKVRSLDRIDVRTEAEIRRQTEKRFGVSRWEKHAMRTIKLTGGAGIVSFGILLVYSSFYSPLNWKAVGLIKTTILFGFVAATVLLAVVSVVIIVFHALRYDLTPALGTLVRQSREIGQTARRRWRSKQNRIGRDDRLAGEEGDAHESSTGDESPLDSLRRRYAEGDLTDEQFERLLDTETLEDVEDRMKARE